MIKRSYHFAHFQSDLVLCSLDQIAQMPNGGSVDLIVADRNTEPLLTAKTGLSADIILEPGEASKTLAQVEAIIGVCAERRLSRSSTILAFGGGVLCDLTGFAAASYMRGCGLVLVPTTLLSMVDASLGGKTACNFRDYKNMIGAFYPAREVRIVPEVLGSLPAREFHSGLAELCKHALLSDSTELWDKLHEPKIRESLLKGASGEIQDLLLEGVHVKGQIVERDLYEHAERAFLNLGHTFAHALEKVSSFACTHGEAVAWGINQALELSAELSYCSGDYVREVRTLLQSFDFELDLSRLCPEYQNLGSSLVEAMELDKKRSQSGIRLVLQCARGQTFVEELATERIQASLCRHI